MAIQNWCDAPEIHPSQIRVGDIIGTLRPTQRRLTVKMISGPQTTPRRWTFLAAMTTACSARARSQRTS